MGTHLCERQLCSKEKDQGSGSDWLIQLTVSRTSEHPEQRTVLCPLAASEDLLVCVLIGLEPGQWFWAVPRPAQRSSLPPTLLPHPLTLISPCCDELIPRKAAVARQTAG